MHTGGRPLTAGNGINRYSRARDHVTAGKYARNIGGTGFLVNFKCAPTRQIELVFLGK
jgi:hypothetical protein